MTLRSWLNPETREQTRIEKRVAKIPTPDLLGWAELAADGVCQELSLWRRSEEPFHLDEATKGAEVLAAALADLQRRTRP